MTIRRETIERAKRAFENHDEEEARKFMDSLPEGVSFADGAGDETMVVLGSPKAKPLSQPLRRDLT